MRNSAFVQTDERSSDESADWIAKSVPDLAKAIGISDRYAWELVGRGTLPSFKLGGKRLVRRAAVEELFEKLEREEQELRERVAA